MNSSRGTYELLQNEQEEQDNKKNHVQHFRPSSRWHRNFAIVHMTLTAGLVILNMILFRHKVDITHKYSSLQKQYNSQSSALETTKAHMHIEKSAHALLVAEIDSTYYEKTAYNDLDNVELQDTLWANISIDAGIIALPDSYVAEKGLPNAQRFPWDDQKGIYLLGGHHHLHCLKSIYQSLRAHETGAPQPRSPWHLYHCLDALRRQIICDADDTPRASTREFSPNTGVGQHRKCRSWDRLEEWAREYSACFKYVHLKKGQSRLERFKYCPEGSQYTEKIRQYFQTTGAKEVEGFFPD